MNSCADINVSGSPDEGAAAEAACKEQYLNSAFQLVRQGGTKGVSASTIAQKLFPTLAKKRLGTAVWKV